MALSAKTQNKPQKTKSGSFKIVPVLIFFCFLAFTIKLVEVYSGVSTIVFQAMAEEDAGEDAAEPAMPPEMPSEIEEGEGLVPTENVGLPDEALEFIEDGNEEEDQWRDPNDGDVPVTSIRMDMLEDLVERRKELDDREKQLATQKALLEAAEKEMDRKFQELTQLRQQIENLLEKQSDEEKKRIQSLVKVYEGMKAKDAARIFDTLDLDILVAVMSNMSERKMSPILAAMNPERARTVTILLAEQKKLPSLPNSN